MAIDLSKYKTATTTQSGVDLSKYKLQSTQPAAQQPGLAQKIWGDIVSRGNANVDIFSQYSNSPDSALTNGVVGGFKLTANTVNGVGDVLNNVAEATPVVGNIYSYLTGKAQEGFNTLTDSLSSTKFFQEAAASPDATKGLENALSIASSSGDIANNILAAQGTASTFKPVTKLPAKASEFASKVTQQSEDSLHNSMLQSYEKGVKPTIPGKTTTAQFEKYRGDVIKAVNTIQENKPNLQFTDDVGDVIAGQNPKTLQQFTDAIEQTKKSIFQQYDALAQQAGDAGLKIDTQPIGSVLDDVINNESIQFTHPEAVKYAQDLKARLALAKLPDGSPMGYKQFNAKTAQDIIQNYNKSLEAFYRNPSYETASRAVIDAAVVNNMRESLDKAISGLTGENYQALKSKYGALKSIEKDVVKATLRDSRKNFKGLIDFGDVFSGGQVVGGILSLNPAQVASGLTQKAIAEYIKFLNNPNRAVKNLFESADNYAFSRESKAQTPAANNPSTKNANTAIPPSIPQQAQTATIALSSPNSIMNTVKGVVNKIKTEGQRGFVKNPLAQSSEDSLLAEARKYKTPEEFVKAQGDTVYHGTPNTENISALRAHTGVDGYFGNGVYLSRDKEVARRFTKRESLSPTLEPTGDGNFQDINTGKIVKGGKPGVIDVLLPKDLKLKTLTIDEMDNLIEKYRKPNGAIDLKAARNSIRDDFAKQGFDGFEVPATKYFDEPQTVIFPQSEGKIKTAPQLTDLWKKAHAIKK